MVVLRPEDWAAWLHLSKPQGELLVPLPVASFDVEIVRQGATRSATRIRHCCGGFVMIGAIPLNLSSCGIQPAYESLINRRLNATASCNRQHIIYQR